MLPQTHLISDTHFNVPQLSIWHLNATVHHSIVADLVYPLQITVYSCNTGYVQHVPCDKQTGHKLVFAPL